MGKPCSCTQFIKSRIFYCKSRENPYQYCKSRENPYQVLQVTRESVSGTTSHVRCVGPCNEIEGSYDKIIITIVPSYTGENITSLLPLALLLVLRTRNNTDGNKLVIFSGIALYYGDNYILTRKLFHINVIDSNGFSIDNITLPEFSGLLSAPFWFITCACACCLSKKPVWLHA